MSPWLKRIFSIAIRTYPREFRDEYATSIADHFESAGDERGSALRSLLEILTTSIAMRAENLWRDIVYAARMNVKAPLFTGVVIGAIALSIATNTVAFALLDAVLLKPLPYPDPGHLGMIWQRSVQGSSQTFTSLSTAQVKSIATDSSTFSIVTASMGQDTIAAQGGAALTRIRVMSNYFTTLGVRPELGSFFSRSSSERDAVISFALWQQRFGGDGQVVGRRLVLDGKSYRIVAVAPADMLDPNFARLLHSDVWTLLPRVSGDNLLAVFPVVRLRSGATWQAAQSELTRIERNADRAGAPVAGSAYYTGSLGQSILAQAGSFLWMVFAAVTGVLLIACANVANLLLARAAVRENEFAVRSAVGASMQRIASQVFTETFLLALIGTALGLLGAWIALPWAKTNIPEGFPRLAAAHIDSSVLLYVAVLLIGVTMLTGMLPAYSRRKTSRRAVTTRVRSLLVVTEVAIAFALTVAFGLVLRSFVTMTNVQLGFSPQNVYAAVVAPRGEIMFSPNFTPARPQTLDRTVQAIRAIPGVQNAAVATNFPFQNGFDMLITFSKGPTGNGAPSQPIAADQVGRGYFNLMRIPMISGRPFNRADFTSNTRNIAVNQSFVRTYFPNQNVIGKTIGDSPQDRWRVVAVIADTRTSFKQTPQPRIYFPYNGGFGPYYGFAIRVARPVPHLAEMIAAVVRRAQPGSGSVTVTSVEDFVRNDAADMRTSLELLGALAAVAVLLGLAGIYSVGAYNTERRFHEIGIRMAVGARPQDILSLIVGSALLQGGAGVAGGIVLSAFAARLLESQLYKTSPLDPATLLSAMAFTIACAAIAALVPAYRASVAGPTATLRYE